MPVLDFMKSKIIWLYIASHVIFISVIGRFYALAPDEPGYLFAFNNIYGSAVENPQYNSGWITSPKFFLWIIYAPAKVLNMVGIADIFSIRLLSVLLGALSLYLLLGINSSRSRFKFRTNLIISLSFFIPSIFIWTSIGLREVFIITEISAFLVGLDKFFNGNRRHAYILLAVSSYGLVATKYYLWGVLMVAVLISCLVFVVQKIKLLEVLRFLLASFVIPILIFSVTVSTYSLSFMLNTDIEATSQRSGDSIIEVTVSGDGSSNGSSSGSSNGSNNGSSNGSNNGSSNGSSNGSNNKVLTFHGDMTLVLLRDYIQIYPEAALTRILKIFGIDKKIDQIWKEKIQLGLVSKTNKVGDDTSSLNGHILEPASLKKPISLLQPAMIFLLGPFPLVGNPGLAVSVASFESPLWWLLYIALFFTLFVCRKDKIYKDPTIALATIFLLGEIAMSALVEVNLGTSFRHRSIILIPLLFIIARLYNRRSELSESST